MSDDTSSTAPTTDEPSEHDNLVDELTPSSVLAETPDVDINQYVEAQKRAMRRARLILQFLAGVVIVGVPFALYMHKTGHLSRAGLTSVVQPSGQAGSGAATSSTSSTSSANPSFSVSPMPANASSSSAVPVEHTKKDPAVAKDLSDYTYKGLKAINPEEKKALEAFESVTGKNYTSTQTTNAVMRDTVVPAYTRFVRGAEAIHPRTAPVQAVHRVFLLSAKLKLRAFQHTLEGASEKDDLWQVGAKAEFDASGQAANQFRVLINRLAQDQGVKLP